MVLLADIEDFTMGEIAAIMKCPVGTVKSQIVPGARDAAGVFAGLPSGNPSEDRGVTPPDGPSA